MCRRPGCRPMSAPSTPALNGFGFDTVDIGDSASIQGIVGDLFINNPFGSTAVAIVDTAQTGERHANLSSFSNDAWGSISGLSPATINFAWNDMYNQSVDVLYFPEADISWTVNPNAHESVVGVYVFAGWYDLAIN